jgi:hypothetical protein
MKPPAGARATQPVTFTSSPSFTVTFVSDCVRAVCAPMAGAHTSGMSNDSAILVIFIGQNLLGGCCQIRTRSSGAPPRSIQHALRDEISR